MSHVHMLHDTFHNAKEEPWFTFNVNNMIFSNQWYELDTFYLGQIRWELAKIQVCLYTLQLHLSPAGVLPLSTDANMNQKASWCQSIHDLMGRLGPSELVFVWLADQNVTLWTMSLKETRRNQWKGNINPADITRSTDACTEDLGWDLVII